MTIVPRNIDGSLEHECTKRNSWDPGPEAENEEHDEDEEDDASSVILPIEHVDGCHKTEYDAGHNIGSEKFQQSRLTEIQLT